MTNKLDHSDHLLFGQLNTESEKRRAMRIVRRITDQHGCLASAGQPCGHPDHRRDEHFHLTLLQMLGLDRVPLEESEETRC